MENVIVVVILLAIVVGIVGFLLRAKKRGETCIGCPHAKQCGGEEQQKRAARLVREEARSVRGGDGGDGKDRERPQGILSVSKHPGMEQRKHDGTFTAS